MDEHTDIDALNRRFRIPGVAEVAPGNGGLTKVVVSAQTASAEVYLQGAQITSWTPSNAEEVIFLSRHSQWVSGKAIRGGIPICFPWFRAKKDDPQAPSHGFVRTKQWQLDTLTTDDSGSVTLTCSTESDDSTLRWWPHEFRLVHRITIGSTLRLELVVTNRGNMLLEFEEALHTYFRVGQVQSLRVRGLDQVMYLDNTDGNREKTQMGDVVIRAATDNAYLDTFGPLELIDSSLKRTIRTAKTNSATTVVWNPWQQGAAALADLGNDEWQQMTCVEACNILNCAISLPPGETHTMCATLNVTSGT
jgi:glucose-6-phosphate 1-epimerase